MINLRARQAASKIASLFLLAGMAFSAAVARPSTPADFAVRSVWELDGDLAPGDYIWDDEGVPAGQLRIVVDLEAELLYVYRGGSEIGRSTMIYGYDDKPTPTGVFPILFKKADHYSSTYGGAPMPYTLRLTRSGVAIHGSVVEADYATHGCIGLPKEFARLLFSQARVGDRVLVTRGWLQDDYDPQLAARERPARVLEGS